MGSSDSGSSSDEEVQVQTKKPQQRLTAAAILFSDDEGDDKRVVRSAKEKRFEALYSIIKLIRNSMKIKDFNKMLTSYEELLKAYDKAKKVIVQEREKDKLEGKNTKWWVGDSPRFYVRILVEMEKLINETWEDAAGRKAMSKVNGKSLGSLRQKLRKYMSENMADDIAKFDPEADEESGDEDEEKDDDDDSDDEGCRGARARRRRCARRRWPAWKMAPTPTVMTGETLTATPTPTVMMDSVLESLTPEKCS